MPFVHAKFTADDIVQGMLDDHEFAHSVWNEISNALDAGMMQDDLVDMVAYSPKIWADIFAKFRVAMDRAEAVD